MSDVEWITIKGVHIPIGAGETKEQAIAKHFNKQADEKDRQIAGNKIEGDQLNSQYSNTSNHTTQMSAQDQQILADSKTGYFQSSNSFDINEALRNSAVSGRSVEKELEDLMTPNIDKTIQTIQTLDKNMKPLDEDISVTRMADNKYINALATGLGLREVNTKTFTMQDAEVLKNNLVGCVIKEPSYMSTTYSNDLKGNVFTNRPVIIRMIAKKGTKGLFSPTGKESEFVLARNSTYKFTDVQYQNGKLILYAMTV